jgi:hypothetical protein
MLIGADAHAALLAQVRNFVAFNKGLTFRTALRTLLEIGYQARVHTDAHFALHCRDAHLC